ncbi:MAG: ArsR/SmtB family transcription factor [Bacteroidota bacterium]
MNKALFQLHAEVCKTLANPKRLEILDLLRDGELNVSDLVSQMRVSKANVSQHLAVMRRAGIVGTRRDGANVYYRVSNPKVTKACELMREVLTEHHSRTQKILKQQR